MIPRKFVVVSDKQLPLPRDKPIDGDKPIGELLPPTSKALADMEKRWVDISKDLPCIPKRPRAKRNSKKKIK